MDPVGAMGIDSPLSVLSDRPQLLYTYFKQLFAQVTNPPIDALREAIITSSVVMLGSEGNLLRPTPESSRRLRLEAPVIDNEQLAQLKSIDKPGFKSMTFPIVFPANQGGKGLEKALDSLFEAVTDAVLSGTNIIILSDQGVDEEHAAIPALLAVSGLHHHLIRNGAAYPRQHRAGIRGTPGGPSFRMPDQLRRFRDQPLSGAGNRAFTQ